jgi:allantoin racemase
MICRWRILKNQQFQEGCSTGGCSATFWLYPFLQKRLSELGWEIPVLKGYSCAIELAKLIVGLQLAASGLAFPSDHPKKWQRKKTF